MPYHIAPKVNQIRTFREIAENFRNPKEILREAISNSWDANANEVSLNFRLSRVPGTSAKSIDVELIPCNVC